MPIYAINALKAPYVPLIYCPIQKNYNCKKCHKKAKYQPGATGIRTFVSVNRTLRGYNKHLYRAQRHL